VKLIVCWTSINNKKTESFPAYFNLIKFICLWADTTSTVWTHTLCWRQVYKNRQNSTEYKALKPEESQGYRHFLQLHWRQNH